MGGDAGGKGDTSTKTNQTAQNFQSANNGSGVNIGGSGNQAAISITNTDIDAVKASLDSSQAVTSAALASNLAVSNSAIGGVTSIAGKFADDLTTVQTQNIALLQSVGDNLVQNELGNKQVENAALQAAFSVAQGAAPQTGAYENETVSATISSAIKWAIIAGAIVGVAYALS